MGTPRKAADNGDATVLQAEPTRPRPISDIGRQLDEHGLPLNGPARARELAERGIPDLALQEVASVAAGDNGQEG